MQLSFLGNRIEIRAQKLEGIEGNDALKGRELPGPVYWL